MRANPVRTTVAHLALPRRARQPGAGFARMLSAAHQRSNLRDTARRGDHRPADPQEFHRNLAVQLAALAQNEDTDGIRRTLHAVVSDNPDVLSVAMRRATEEIAAEAESHLTGSLGYLREAAIDLMRRQQ